MLPSSLLDLLCHRLSAQANALTLHVQTRGHVRCVQQLAVQHAGGHELHIQKALRRTSEPASRDGHSLRVRQAEKQVQAVTELEERVTALKNAAVETSQVENASHEGPHFPEAELQDIYRDLLSFPTSETKVLAEQAKAELIDDSPPDIIRVLAERLLMFEAALHAMARGTGLSSKLKARTTPYIPSMNIKRTRNGLQNDLLLQEGESPLRALINRLRTILDSLQPVRPPASVDDSVSETPSVPLGLLSNTEWRAFSQACLDADDAPASEGVLNLMKRSGLVPPDEQHDAILDWYATRGLVEEADSFTSRLSIDVPRERQRDLLVKARIKAKRLDDACELIHTLETRTIPAPMQSYTRVIQALLTQRGPGSEQQKAQAWDMFSHMRYVAHATADDFLYSVMIRACAESADPEPERALDLFTEMTVERKLAPTTHAYNAVILTCARSKRFALDAFRLAREMLNSHRDAHGEIPIRLQPDKNTFCALLEAAKRMGDLSRARWILAQMTQSARDAQAGAPSVYIDEKVMTHVFHAYAAYRPPFRREAVAFVSREEMGRQSTTEQQDEASSQMQGIETTDVRQPRGVPQSRQEVIEEVSTLWKRILEDRRIIEHTRDDPSRAIFGRVSLTTSLLNAYMTVYYAHSPPSASHKVYSNLFEPLGIQRDGFTYVHAIEACANRKHASELELRIALSFARDVWKHWRELENAGVMQVSGAHSKVDARLVERAWSAMMRILTLNGHLNEASDHLHQFVERYPPTHVKQPSPSDPNRSTRTKLYAERPIVRLTERSAVPEDRITPFLTFMDLSLLHHRAIAAKRTPLINYIKWVGKAYEGALRRRRDATLRGTQI